MPAEGNYFPELARVIYVLVKKTRTFGPQLGDSFPELVRVIYVLVKKLGFFARGREIIFPSLRG